MDHFICNRWPDTSSMPGASQWKTGKGSRRAVCAGRVAKEYGKITMHYHVLKRKHEMRPFNLSKQIP